ncbi:hypothetical protein MNBD_GAMMA22-2553 [hydrothermal vent metagenome]|uniref:Shikimate kinase n=1 Tax=hydrothermal vent metagenome TaxID=652676 RepID=A0A3B1AHH1_9ZZZZ
MKRIIIFGNSGSGKSTLSQRYASEFNLTHLDLDILAWKDTDPPSRQNLNLSSARIKLFMAQNENWVIEGGYTDLLNIAIENTTEIIFLNLDVESCIQNCRNRPWESHKYDSIEKQNANLSMLIDWVKQYPERTDVFSHHSHTYLYNTYSGKKNQYYSNICSEVKILF